MVSVGVLTPIITSVVIGLGYELWGCELLQEGRNQTLRIYIDRSQGVDVEDCATVSRQISAALDVEHPILTDYILEVSSPGIDRFLFSLDHYARYLGHKIRLRLKTAQPDRRKNFVGILKAVSESSISLSLEKEEVHIEYHKIAQANLVP